MILYVRCFSVCVRVLHECSDFVLFFFQAEDGIRDLVRSRGLGDVYKRQRIDGAMLRDVCAYLGLLSGLILLHVTHHYYNGLLLSLIHI